MLILGFGEPFLNGVDKLLQGFGVGRIGEQGLPVCQREAVPIGQVFVATGSQRVFGIIAVLALGCALEIERKVFRLHTAAWGAQNADNIRQFCYEHQND